MGKKSKKSSHFDYYTKSGKIGNLMDRFDIEGVHYGHPDGRSGKPNRSMDDVDKDIAKAMMNDYDYRRSVEAAAMAGEKGAKKFAKKGFSAKNIYKAADFMQEMKKKYVGGGGMNGPDNRASLTYALVQNDRQKQTEGYENDFALGADLAALKEEMDTRFDKHKENTPPADIAADPPEPSPTDDYELNLGTSGSDIFGGGSPQEQAQADQFKTDVVAQVKKGIQLSDVETRGPKSGVRPGAGF